MNLVQAIRFYIKKMTDEIGSGMKKLLLDQDTVLIKFLNVEQSFFYKITSNNLSFILYSIYSIF